MLVIGNQNNVWTHNVIQFRKGSLKKRLKIDRVSHVENLFLHIFGIFDLITFAFECASFKCQEQEQVYQ